MAYSIFSFHLSEGPNNFSSYELFLKPHLNTLTILIKPLLESVLYLYKPQTSLWIFRADMQSTSFAIPP